MKPTRLFIMFTAFFTMIFATDNIQFREQIKNLVAESNEIIKAHRAEIKELNKLGNATKAQYDPIIEKINQERDRITNVINSLIEFDNEDRNIEESFHYDRFKSKKAEIESDINTKKASYDADKNQRIRDLRDKKPATDNRDTCDSVSASGYLEEYNYSYFYAYNYWDVCFYNSDTSESFCDMLDVSNIDSYGYYNTWNLNYTFSAGTWIVDLYQYTGNYNYNNANLFLSFEDGQSISLSYDGYYYVSGSFTIQSCDAPGIPGCTNPDAFNYDPTATAENGTCILDGCPGFCIDDFSCNYWVYISNGYYTHADLMNLGCFCPEVEGGYEGCEFMDFDSYGNFCVGSDLADGICFADADDCGVVNGDNSTCTDDCGVVNGDNSTCTDDCGVVNGDNSTCLDDCGVANGDNSTCTDDCGVVNGDNSSCLDDCGVANGDNSTCLDECGTPNGNGECINIVSIMDVPYDQGGFVFINWLPIGWDTYNYHITYYVYRYIPSSRGWELLHEAPGMQFEEYGFTAPTNQTSIPDQELFYETEYFIRAVDSNGNYYDSQSVYGYSADNLAPSTPTMLNAEFEDNRVILSWDHNIESDLREYNIYRNNIFLNSTLENSFIDDSFLQGEESQYNITAVDVYYNESNFSLSVNVETALIGDVNFDNVINIVDVVALVGHILGTSPLSSICEADTNDDGILNVVDVVALVGMILGD